VCHYYYLQILTQALATNHL